MPVAQLCPSFKVTLKIPETAAGHRVRCPGCGHLFVFRLTQVEEHVKEVPEAAPAKRRSSVQAGAPKPKPKPLDDDEPVLLEEVVEEEPPVAPSRKRRPDAEGITAKKRRRHRDDEPEELEEVTEDDLVEPRERRRKKPHRRERRAPVPEDEERSYAWLWWVGGGGGIAATFVVLILIAVFAESESYLEFAAVNLIVMLPISTVIFFVAMVLSNLLAGAIDIGEIHVAVVKSFALLVVVNIVGQIPLPFGMVWGATALQLFVWLLGLMTLFRLDVWEARVLILINWILNVGVNLLLTWVLMSLIMHAGDAVAPSGSQGAPPHESQPIRHHDRWDDDD